MVWTAQNRHLRGFLLFRYEKGHERVQRADSPQLRAGTMGRPPGFGLLSEGPSLTRGLVPLLGGSFFRPPAAHPVLLGAG